MSGDSPHDMEREEGCAIVVTADDIVLGNRHSRRSCPIAIAAAKTLGAKSVSVSTTYIWNGNTLYSIPFLVQLRIWLFDNFGWMRPFSFMARRHHFGG